MQSNALLAWRRFYDAKSGRYTFIVGLFWVMGWWTVGVMPDNGALPPLPHRVSLAKAKMTKTIKRCNVTRRLCKT
jgi:hypothetical protein